MKKLQIEPYCDECPYFEADVDTLVIGDYDRSRTETIISCERREMCAIIAAHIKLKLKEVKEGTKEELKEGFWKDRFFSFVCSQCGTRSIKALSECPNCKARMRTTTVDDAGY